LLTVDWIINSLYCDTVQYKSLLSTLLFVQNGLQCCDKVLQDKLNHVIFCKQYTTSAFDIFFVMVAYLMVFKLD